MWDDVQGGKSDVVWIGVALHEGSFIGVTDGSYDRDRAKTVSVRDRLYAASGQETSSEARSSKSCLKLGHIEESSLVWLPCIP